MTAARSSNPGLARLAVILPLAAVSLPAWGVLIASSGLEALPLVCTSGLLWSVPSLDSFAYLFVFVSPSLLALGWALMVAAMMLPTLVDILGHVRARSFPIMRPRLMALVMAGFSGLWLLSGVMFLALALTLRLAAPGPLPLLGALALALLWQASPWKQAALNRCHSRPLQPAFAPAAYVAALRLGLRSGCWCLATCWPLMLAGLLTPAYHLTAMALVTLIIWIERFDPPRPPSWGLRLPCRVPSLAIHAARSAFQSARTLFIVRMPTP